MLAAVTHENGLRITDIAKPKPAPNEVLIKVHACGMNRIDSIVAGGGALSHSGGMGTVPGVEFVGEVHEIGSDVPSVKPGDSVMCISTSGWAEFATSDWRMIVPIPSEKITWCHAASLLGALMTMHNAVITAGRMKPGETVMIQGASSGVGLMGMQIAKMMGAKLVIGSSTNLERRARLTEFGADLAVDSRDPGWVDQVLEATDGEGVDLIVDLISGYVANQNLAATKVLGRIVNVGRLGGATGEFNFNLHAARRIDYIGVTFVTRSIEEKHEIIRAMKADLWGAVETGKLSLPIDRVFAFNDAAEAVEYMTANKHFGKIILQLD